MLRIVVEFDNVELAVGGLQQVGLRASAHFADQAQGLNGHSRGKGRRGTLEII